MSTRADIRAAFISKIKAILPDATVDKWDGEEAAFNRVYQWPAVYVAYLGLSTGPDEEVGPAATTYARSFDVLVYVCAKDDALGVGDEQAMDMLEAMETGISGTEIAGVGPAELRPVFEDARCEALLGARDGHYLYGQAWRVQDVESH